MKKIKNTSGITLIALVVTIIVLLILAGISIQMLTGDNGILKNAEKATIMTELSQYKEELQIFKTSKAIDNDEFYAGSLMAGKNSLSYNTQDTNEQGNIKTVIPEINDKYLDTIEIIKGKLQINTKDKNIVEIAKELDIEVNVYTIIDGELISSNENLLLMDENGTLTLPETVSKIGEGAFSNVAGLKKIIIPGTVKTIAENAFSNNTTLESVVIQDGVEEIGDNAFFKCSNLKKVSMPNSVKKIGMNAFYYCSKLEEINLSTGITNLRQQVLDGCVNLKEIILPEGLLTIESGSLACGNLSFLKIPSTVTSIHSDFCFGRNNINQIDTTGNQNYVFEDGFLMSISGEQICYITPQKIKASSTFSIPEGVKSFDYDLKAYTNLNEIVLPSTLTSIAGNKLPTSIEEIEVSSGNQSFIADNENKILYTTENELLQCYSKEEEITIKDGILKVGNTALSGATNAKKIIFPDSLLELEYLCFNRVRNGVEIVLGKNVETINGDFMNVSSGANLTIAEDNPNFKIENNMLYSKDGKKLVKVLYQIDREFTIDSNIEIIGNNAFINQNIVEKITILNSVNEIQYGAFMYCTALKEIEIPSSVTKVGNNCFGYCTNLSKIFINKKENSISGAPWGAPKGMKVVIWNN